MSFREAVQSRLAATAKWPVRRHFPQGVYFARDLKRFYPEYVVSNIFDVGANSGQSAIEYSILFPRARIYSFEPVRKSYGELQQRTRKNPLVSCHQLALGASKSVMKIDTSAGHSSMYAISNDGDEEVEVSTVVDFCRDHQIKHLNFLKVDTEGFDLEVVRGAAALIDEASIDFIQVEASMNPENTFHVYFTEFVTLLHHSGYRLFGIYDQTHEWQTGSPKLRRSNIVFASPALI